MKHLYIEEKFLKHNLKRSKDAIDKIGNKIRKRRKHKNHNQFLPKVIAEAPCIFSILHNTNQTLEYFKKIENIAYQNRKLYIDIKSVKNLTPETVLYLLLVIEKLKKVKNIHVNGNAPKDDKCRQVFLDSGFYDFVQSQYQTNKNKNILSVKSENYVDGRIANEVIEFASTKLGLMPSRVTRAFYTTILECMGNTKEHAYNTHDAKYAKWWLIAQHDESLCKINFAILDNGKGIPETVRKKFLEKIFSYNDADILKSVLMGEFRTSTELQYRGKGLPKIMFFKKEKLIQEVFLISKNGFYDVDKDKLLNINPMFNGTLICWSFIKGECNEDSNSN